jgi:class 3 adenylate cyclase
MIKKSIVSLAFGLLFFVIVHTISTGTSLFDGLNRGVSDVMFNLREPPVEELYGAQNKFVADRVQLVGVDDASLGVVGRWPWPRGVHARYLNRLQRFSPLTVHFDVALIHPQAVPDIFKRQFSKQPDVLSSVTQAYQEMDLSLAREMKKKPNVLIDLFLVRSDRPNLGYIDRVRKTEEVLQKYSYKTNLMEQGRSDEVTYWSMEPILDIYQTNAQPVSVNTPADEDDVLRTFPLVHTYSTTADPKTGGRQARHMTSVVLASLMKLYHVPHDSVDITRNAIVLKSAKVPVLDRNRHQPIVKSMPTKSIEEKLVKVIKPEHFNKNLYQFTVNELTFFSPKRKHKSPYFPIHLLEKDNTFELIEGHELWEAAQRVGSEKVKVIIHRQRDLVIQTVSEDHYPPLPHSIPINFAGQQQRAFVDSYTNKLTHYRPIPTSSYADVYAIADLPDIPSLTGDNTIDESYPTGQLLAWFLQTLPQRHLELVAALREGGHELTEESLLEFASDQEQPLGKYYFYKRFVDDLATQAQAGEINKTKHLRDYIAAYEPWLKTRGWQGLQAFADRFGVHQIVRDLHQEYETNFFTYYNKLVFTGALSLGMAEDTRLTPYESMFGINVIVSAFNTIATDNAITLSDRDTDFIVLLVTCTLLALIYGLFGIRADALAFLVTLVLSFVIPFYVFSSSSYLLTTVPIVFGNLLIFVATIIYKVLTEEKDKTFLKSTFSSYLAPELIDEMYESKTFPKLGGELKHATPYFTDIQGFSSFSEILTAEQLVELLNEYLTVMTDILLGEKGTLDKYEGDAIIAFVGAPMVFPDHTLRAARAAIRMQNALLDLRKKWSQEKVDPQSPSRNTKNLPEAQWAAREKWPKLVHNMKMRIGLNTGDIVVGNMGSAARMNYTMMGDSVNLAARLEEGAKQYGVYTLASEMTVEHEFDEQSADETPTGKRVTLKDLLEVRFIDKIVVVGKTEPVAVYEIVALKGDLTEEERELFKSFNEGMGLYLNMEWDRAAEKFEESKQLERVPDGKTTPSEVFSKRCAYFKDNPPVPPGQSWNGVYTLTSK